MTSTYATATEPRTNPIPETLAINPRFSQPKGSGNGGISAGLAATMLDGPTQVRLRRPPPLGRPLNGERSAGTITVLDKGETVLEATQGTRPVEIPIDSNILSRTFERGATSVFKDHVAPECFVLRPTRRRARRLSPPPARNRNLGNRVDPDASVSSNGLTVDPHIVWGALDCPAGFAVTKYGKEPMTFFPALTCLSAHLMQPLPVDGAVAVFEWLIDEDERRVNGGAAIVGADRTVFAAAHAQHARLPLTFGTG